MSALGKRSRYVDPLTTILASNTSMHTKLIEASKVRDALRPCGPGTEIRPLRGPQVRPQAAS